MANGYVVDLVDISLYRSKASMNVDRLLVLCGKSNIYHCKRHDEVYLLLQGWSKSAFWLRTSSCSMDGDTVSSLLFLCVVYQRLHCYLVIRYISDFQVISSLPPAGFPLSFLFPHVHHNNQWIGLVEKIHTQFREMLVLLVPYVCIYIYSVYNNDGI